MWRAVLKVIILKNKHVSILVICLFLKRQLLPWFVQEESRHSSTHCASRSQCSALSEDKDYRDEDVTINQLIILKKVSKLKLWFVVVAQSSCIQQGACFSHMIAFSAARKLCDNYWTKGGWVISPLLHVLFCDSGGTWLTTVLTMWDESTTENLAFSTLLQA